MSRAIRDQIVTARERHLCDACNAWVCSGYTLDDCTPEQGVAVRAASADGWAILPGQQYRRAVLDVDGRLVTYRARLDMEAVALALELFDD